MIKQTSKFKIKFKPSFLNANWYFAHSFYSTVLITGKNMTNPSIFQQHY